MSLSDGTRYISARYYFDSENNRKMIDNSRAAEASVSLRSHVFKEGETLESLAFLAYKDATKWWKIADANGIFDPLAVIAPGTILEIP